MRLRQLNLIRYGHFTDFTLDFGERPVNGSDFHIIFGDNEAGKSTALNGYLDLLFGIEAHSKYSFLHGYNALRIGAVLEMDNNVIELARIKRLGANLLDADGQPFDEEILTSLLHGLSRDTYQAMFSLNDETLEKGGKEILESKGDLGRLLFAGTAGLADLSGGLQLLRERANKAYAERSRTHEIASLKQELKLLNEKRKNLDTQASAYEHLTETYRDAQKAYQDARKAQDDLLKEKSNLEIFKSAFSIRDDLIDLEAKLALINHLPNVPEAEGWIQEVDTLKGKLDTAEENRDDAQIDIDKANEELEKLAADPMIIKVQEELESISTPAIHAQAAQNELPNLCVELVSVNAKLDEIRQRLGADKIADLTDLVIPDDAIADLSDLLKQEGERKRDLDKAQGEASDAKEDLLQAQDEEKNAASPDEKVTQLLALFNNYSEDDAQRRLEQAEKTLSKTGSEIEWELRNLNPWTGKQDDFRLLGFPTPAQANHWHNRVNPLEKELAIQKRRMAEHGEQRVSYDSRLKTLFGQVGTITDACAVDSRKARDDAWVTHRKRLDDETANVFEKVLADDDEICDKRLIAADCVVELRIVQEDLEKTGGILEVIACEIKRVESDFQAIQDEMRPVFIKAGLPEDFRVENLSEWLERAQIVSKLIKKEEEDRSEGDLARNVYDQRRMALLGALAKVGQELSDTLDLKTLLAIAKTYRDNAIRDEGQHESVKKAVLKAKGEVKRRNKDLKDTKKEFEKWQKNWGQALKGLWFKEKNTSQIQVLLKSLQILATQVRRQSELDEKIRQKEASVYKFHEGVCKLLDSLGLEEEGDVAAQFLLLQNRLKNAQKIDKERSAIESSRAQAEKQLDQAIAGLSRIAKRAKEIAECFTKPEEIATLDHLATILKLAKNKLELVEDVSEKESRLLRCLEIETRADAEMLLKAKTSLSSVEARLARINGDLKEVEQELEKRIEERRDALRAIETIGSDGGVACLDEKYQSILLEISNKADHALALHLGLMAADHALATYRDRHRSELLKQTADAFRAITVGKFSHLATQPDQSGDRLIAVRSNGGSIAAEEMSKGTRFQLYLALRLAGYRRFCSLKEPLPFIGDDIIETFDNDRAESTMRQLSEIARDGQALYFTHHRHLCEIAREVCGDGVVIHEIPKQLLG